MKFFDTTKTSTVVDATGTILNSSLNLVPQGDTESERIGRKIVLKNINMRGQVRIDVADTEGTTIERVRLIVYLDKQCNGAAAGVTDILETASINSFNNLSNKSRFRILADRTIDLVSQAGAYNGSGAVFGRDVATLNLYKKCHLPIEFDNSATTGAITTIRSYNVGVLGVSTAGLVNIEYTTRIRYTDN